VLSIKNKALIISMMDSKTAHIVGKWFEKKYREVDQQVAPYSISCNKGCEGCCFQPIEILNWEEPLILEYIHHQLTSDQKKIVRRRLKHWFDDFDVLIPGKSTQSAHDLFLQIQRTQGSHPLPCIFLHQHQCLIYPVRPIYCRMFDPGEDPERCKYKPSIEDDSTTIGSLRKKVVNDIILKIPSTLNLLNFAVARLFNLNYRTRHLDEQLLQGI
jgi:Fe-S-cluster containining protein